MRIPTKIDPCPIVEAIIETRFTTEIPPGAIFGIVYNEFKQRFSAVEELPILQLPEKIRIADPNLRFKPYYKINDKNFLIQVGPDVVSLINTGEYVGWDNFYNELESFCNSINKIGIIKEPVRLGIRYVNFFELDIYNEIKLAILHDNKLFESKEINIRTLIEREIYKINLQISNKAVVNVSGKSKNGSVIDIDVFREMTDEDKSRKLLDLITEGHKEEKEIFFNLLKEEYLKTLNPEYGE